jgi:hypothetical protein
MVVWSRAGACRQLDQAQRERVCVKKGKERNKKEVDSSERQARSMGSVRALRPNGTGKEGKKKEKRKEGRRCVRCRAELEM